MAEKMVEKADESEKKSKRAKADEPGAEAELESESASGSESESKAEAKAESKPKGDAKPKGKKAKKVRVDPLDAFLAMTDKKWPDTVLTADKTPFQKIPRISTGNIGIDIATYGGWPQGRISRAYGKEKSGKTGALLNTAAEWQKHCAVCYSRYECDPECDYYGEDDRPKAPVLWIDAENRLLGMMDWVGGHGVDLSRFIIQSPPDGQHIVDFVDACIREQGAGIGLIIVDSIAHVVSSEEIEKETTKGRTAPVNALLVNKACRKWTAAVNALGIAHKRKPTILAINQLRQTLDSFGASEVQTGGLGLGYATSLDVRFTVGKYHYILLSEDGSLDDRMVAFGSKFKPEEDAAPDYVEINYRITASGICPMGRYGQYCYWLRNAHGRRLGDPDNSARLWEFSKKYGLIEKDGRARRLFGVEADTEAALLDGFMNNPKAQAKAWAILVEKLIAS